MSYKFKKNWYATRAIDVTFNPYIREIYHLHYHCIIMAPEKGLEAKLTQIWTKALTGTSKKSQWIEEIKHVEKVSKYTAKMAGLGLELVSGFTSKKGKHKQTFSLPQIMEQAIHHPEKDNIFRDIYRQYLLEIAGTRMVTFSRNWVNLIEENQIEEKENDDVIITLHPSYSFSFAGKISIEEIGFLVWQHYLRS